MRERGRSCGTAIGTAAGALSLAIAAGPAQAVEFGSQDGWNTSFDGVINAFSVNAKAKTIGGVGSSISDSRFTSGFNPSKFNAHFKAPKVGGLAVSGNFQYAANIAGGNGSATSAGGGNGGMDVRVLDINVAGDWGTVAIGRSWGIFNGSAIVHDEGSGTGVGALCGVPGGSGGGTCGRIGTGYTWTAFASRIEYDTPDLGGFSARIGLFDPATSNNPAGAFQTKSPRLEAEGSFGGKFDGGAYKVWTGGLHQSLSGPAAGGPSSKLTGADVGAHIDVAGFGLTGAYTKTKGFGASGFKFGVFSGIYGPYGGKEGIVCTAGACAETSDQQMYVDASFKLHNTRFGVSTGVGKQNANAAFATPDIKNTLHMVYVHHAITPQAQLTVEYDAFKSHSSALGGTQTKYNMLVVGLNYFF
jgi:hypothetical protein